MKALQLLLLALISLAFGAEGMMSYSDFAKTINSLDYNQLIAFDQRAQGQKELHKAEQAFTAAARLSTIESNYLKARLLLGKVHEELAHVEPRNHVHVINAELNYSAAAHGGFVEAQFLLGRLLVNHILTINQNVIEQALNYSIASHDDIASGRMRLFKPVELTMKLLKARIETAEQNLNNAIQNLKTPQVLRNLAKHYLDILHLHLNLWEGPEIIL